MLPRYFREYQWSNIAAMIRNNRRDPKICTKDFRDRLVVISGATSGIGYHTARKFASQGARLLCINRNEEKSIALKTEIEKEYGVICEYVIADLSVLKDVFSVAEKLNRIDTAIDVLIHNAGIYLTHRELTAEGFDKVFTVHHLASFVINILISEKLISQGRGKIILVSSEGHRFAPWGLRLDDLNWEKRRYSGLKSYGSAKLAQLLTMIVFSEFYKPWGVTINAMHPGAVRSETGKDNGAIYRWIKKNLFDKTLRPTEISAESLYYIGVSEETEGVTGKFFNLTTLEEPAPPALDKEAAKELWAKSIEMTGLKDLISKF
ncbi:MAG: SDR family NAD(P)-dependent oxidoreductase [Bacteroidales bacterium]|nr:SDR family NAD(P)-dependent oxidoreductase [Bacteroidales bacterium]MBN2631982.1 SDR family NAD(P)-dependent oxidoreductase [Bacteroidales bacterium]